MLRNHIAIEIHAVAVISMKGTVHGTNRKRATENSEPSGEFGTTVVDFVVPETGAIEMRTVHATEVIPCHSIL